jgi:hypothetical protein
MNQSDRNLWPFKRRTSVISSVSLLFGLLIILALVRSKTGWLNQTSLSSLLIGVLVLSLLPLLLVLLDVIIERGGKIEFKGVKIDFAQARQMGMSGITVPANIGVRGEPVNDSSTMRILETLKRATSCDVVIIDLEEGQAWWETRLLVLLSGAERLRKPEKIVFVGTEAGKQHCFQGWAHATDLFRLIVNAHPKYRRILETAKAAAKKWELVEPLPQPPPPSPPPQIQPGLATQHYPWMVLDNSGLLNPFLPEQLLASELGGKIEMMPEGPRTLSLVRLEELFRPVLLKDRIEQSWPNDRQIRAFFDSDEQYFAITQRGQYSILVARLTVLSQMLKPLIQEKTGA